MQPLIVAILTQAQGQALVRETVFEDRFAYVSELCKMGANISLKDGCATVCGCDILKGEEVYGKDLRGGMALVLAALNARGKSIIHGVEFIERGYENIVENLTKLGGNINYVEEELYYVEEIESEILQCV